MSIHNTQYNKYKKTIKLKDEVGMAGSKSTRTRFVRHKHLLYIPSLTFLDYYAPSYVIMLIYNLSSVACGRHSGCSLVVTMVQDSHCSAVYDGGLLGCTTK